MYDTHTATGSSTVAAGTLAVLDVEPDFRADLDADLGAGFDLDVLTVPIGETPTSRRIVDSGTYTCSTQSCCTSNSCH